MPTARVPPRSGRWLIHCRQPTWDVGLGKLQVKTSVELTRSFVVRFAGYVHLKAVQPEIGVPLIGTNQRSAVPPVAGP